MRRGYRLLTSGGPMAALVLVVLDLGVVLDSWTWWRGDGLWATQQFGTSVQLGLPVLLALLAAPPVLRGGIRTDQALMPLAPVRARLRRLIADAGPVLGTHLGFVVGAVALSLHHGDRPDPTDLSLAVGVQTLAIVFLCAAGRAIGELVRHPVAVAIAAALGAVLLGFAGNAFPLSAGSSPYVGLELTPGPYLAAIAALALATPLTLLRARGAWEAAATVVAVVGVILAGQHLPSTQLRPSGAQADTCTEAVGVRVCVYPGYRHLLDSLAESVAGSLEPLRRRGIDPHLAGVVQPSPGVNPPAGTVPFPFSTTDLEKGRILPGRVRGTLLNPTWCPALSAAAALPAWFESANRQVYHWLEHAEGATDEVDYRRRLPGFARLPVHRQELLVQQYFDKIRDCEGLR